MITSGEKMVRITWPASHLWASLIGGPDGTFWYDLMVQAPASVLLFELWPSFLIEFGECIFIPG